MGGGREEAMLASTRDVWEDHKKKKEEEQEERERKVISTLRRISEKKS